MGPRPLQDLGAFHLHEDPARAAAPPHLGEGAEPGLEAPQEEVLHRHPDLGAGVDPEGAQSGLGVEDLQDARGRKGVPLDVDKAQGEPFPLPDPLEVPVEGVGPALQGP